MITVRVSQIRIDKAKIMRAVESAVKDPLDKAGMIVESLAKRSMQRGGRLHHTARGPRGGKPTGIPSAPGTPPHVQKGILRASITHARSEKGTELVGPTKEAWYGKVHEFGGRYHPQRPFMRPALFNAMSKFGELFRNLKLR